MKNKKPYLIEEDSPTDWFEKLYAGSNTAGEGVPWANMETHPSFQKWMETHPLIGEGKSALVVGCGMGDDAVELERRGFKVTAFDVSETAIKLCKKTMKTVRQNLFWAFIYNIILIPVAAGVLYPFDFLPNILRQLHPILAALAMAVSSITVVSNSLRLHRVKLDL